MNWETESYTLKYPVTVGDEEVTVLTLKMPNGKALRAIDAMNLGQGGGEMGLPETMDLITHFAPDAPEGFADELHPADIKGAGEKMAPLLSDLFALAEPEPEEVEEPEAVTEPAPQGEPVTEAAAAEPATAAVTEPGPAATVTDQPQ